MFPHGLTCSARGAVLVGRLPFLGLASQVVVGGDMLISWPPQVVFGAGSFHVIHWLAVLDVGYAVLQRHIN